MRDEDQVAKKKKKNAHYHAQMRPDHSSRQQSLFCESAFAERQSTGPLRENTDYHQLHTAKNSQFIGRVVIRKE